MRNTPSSEAFPVKEWPATPTSEDIREITDLYESECAVEECDPLKETYPMAIFLFLSSQKITEDSINNLYQELIAKELKKRYPLGQTELPL